MMKIIEGIKDIISSIELLPRRKFFVLLMLLVILTAIIWWPFFSNFKIQGTDWDYNRLGMNLAKGKGFSIIESEGKTMYMEPGYPFFLAVSYKIFGIHPNIIRFEQLLLLFFICFFCYLVARQVVSELAAKLSVILLAIFSPLNIYSSFIQSEILTTFLLLLFTLVLILARRREKIYLFGLGGLIFGSLVLVKATFLYLLIFLLIIFFIKFGERKLLKISFFISAFLIIISPWLYRNYILFDKLMIADRAGSIVWNHAIKVTYNKEQIKDFAEAVILGEYFVKVRKPDFALEDIDGNIMRKNEYNKIKQAGKNVREVDTILMKQAVDLMFRRPFKFFSLGIFEVILLNTPMVPVYPLTQTFSGTNIYEFKSLKQGILILIRLIWLTFLVLVVLGFFKILKRNKFGGLLIALYVFYVNGIFLGLEGVPRLLLPIYPYYFILFAYALAGLRIQEYKNTGIQEYKNNYFSLFLYFYIFIFLS